MRDTLFSFPLPSPEDVLGGGNIKLLQHDAAGLRTFIEGFKEHILSPQAAEKLVNIEQHLAHPEWVKAHDAAHHGLMNAFKRASTQAEMAAHTHLLESIVKSQLPNANTLKAVTHPELQKLLEPTIGYLNTWHDFTTQFRGLTARFLKPAEGQAGMTLAQFKQAAPRPTHVFTAVPATPPSNVTQPHVHGPDCDHGPVRRGMFARKQEPTGMPPATSHMHGPECNHTPLQNAAHMTTPPKGNIKGWALAGIGGAAAGAYLLNQYGTSGEDAQLAEQAKSGQDRAEDIAYTINHALSCGTTDVVLQPIISAAFGVNVGCNHPEHHHPKQKLTLKTFAHEAGHYFKGEIIGDMAAVPMTIAVQRTLPNMMNGIRKLCEPVFGWAFRAGATRNAQRWGKDQGLTADAPEVKAHAEASYQHEVSHLPQAVVWNMFAYPIGAVAQKMGGHGRSYGEIFKSKLVGGVVSNSLLIGGRMLAPDAAQKWDRVMGENVFSPVSKTVASILGVDTTQKQKSAEASTWAERLDERQQSQQVKAKAP